MIYNLSMSALPSHTRGPGYAGLRMTADEFLSLGETTDRYQLVDGIVLMSPSPTPLHQRIKLLVAQQAMATDSPLAGGPDVFLDTDVRFDTQVVYCPDVAVYRSGRLTSTPARLTQPPDLIVEVLSPGNKPLDLVTKRADYERFGVNEYWVFDPETTELRCWRADATGHYAAGAVQGDRITSSAIPAFTLDLGPIRALCRSAEA
jgi:Uma2 family endonuclease